MISSNIALSCTNTDKVPSNIKIRNLRPSLIDGKHLASKGSVPNDINLASVGLREPIGSFPYKHQYSTNAVLAWQISLASSLLLTDKSGVSQGLVPMHESFAGRWQLSLPRLRLVGAHGGGPGH